MRKRLFALPAALALVATTLAACGHGSVTDGPTTKAASGAAGQPKSGGTLKVLGQSDVFNIDPVSAYYTVSNMLNRAFTRQLFSYSTAATFAEQLPIQPDMATSVPTTANGGITDGGKTITVKIRPDVMWSTSPARAVVAGDFVREFQMLCNPVSPNGAMGYFTATIQGMADYCSAFAKAPATVAGIQSFVSSHTLSGVSAPDPTTVVFHLLTPSADFLNILALGFCSARPVEYMQYLPDSAPFRQHTLSDGPYMITAYTATKSMTLKRNPNWKAANDPLRKAYVDEIDVTEGLTADSVQQQLQAGTGDMEWDVTPPTQNLPALEANKDPNLVIGPDGDSYVDIGTYLAMNQYKGPFTNKLVRQAASYAVNKNAIVQILGGPKIAATTNQVILPGSIGYAQNFNPYPDNNGAGDPAKAKQLLAQAGYPNGVPIKLLYSTTDPMPRVAQAIQASLKPAGFNVTLVPATQADFYGKYLENPSTAKAGTWDMAPPGWIPDWFGNNGRATIVPMLTQPGPGSNDFGGYVSPAMQADVDKALTASNDADAGAAWQAANEQAINDAGIIPVNVQKWPVYHSSAVQNCQFSWYTLNCDLTNVWLKR